ncbi:hypothetical protein Dimus_013133 [Dionaea muscipula]
MDVEEGEASASGVVGFPYWKSTRRYFTPDSPFFASGNVEREILAKQVALDLTETEKQQLEDTEADGRKFFCPIVGCGARLISLECLEDHYNARHTASCSVCSRVYPTSRLLSIHVSEAHDSFFRAKVAKGFAMYECLVESCGMKFKSYESRQQHLVGKHRFPAAFEFYKKARPSKKQRQKDQQHKQSYHGSRDDSNAMQVEDETMNSLVYAVSKLSTSDSTPSSVSFGRRHRRGLTFAPRVIHLAKNADAESSISTPEK